MKERKKNTIIKTTISLLSVDLLVAGLVILLIGPWKFNGEVYNTGNNIPLVVGLVIVLTVLLDFVIGFLLYLSFDELERRKESIKIVKNSLSNRIYKEVIPIKACNYKEFVLNLTKRAKFYAIIGENSHLIIITIQFNEENEREFFDSIDTGYFMEFYKLKDDLE